jgi:hypothetical protein
LFIGWIDTWRLRNIIWIGNRISRIYLSSGPGCTIRRNGTISWIFLYHIRCLYLSIIIFYSLRCIFYWFITIRNLWFYIFVLTLYLFICIQDRKTQFILRRFKALVCLWCHWRSLRQIIINFLSILSLICSIYIILILSKYRCILELIHIVSNSFVLKSQNWW